MSQLIIDPETEVDIERLATPRARMRLAIIDDEPIFTIGLLALIAEHRDIEVVGQTADDAGILWLAKSATFDVALIACTSSNATAWVRRVRGLVATCRIVVVVNPMDAVGVAELLHNGADACAWRTDAPAKLVSAIRLAQRGTRCLPETIDTGAVETLLGSDASWGLDRLTGRERETFALLVQGFTNAAIAARLSISHRTVETHRRHVMQKLGVASIVELMQFAARRGLVH